METPELVAIESFSCSWLSDDHKPSLAGLDEPPRISIDNYYGGNSEEFYYEMVGSNRFLTDSNFSFAAIAETPAVFIHADDLFTDGFIRPIYVDPSTRQPSNNTLDSIQTMPSSSFSSRTEVPKERNIRCSFLGRCRKSTQQILRNLLGNLRPFCHKVGCLPKSTRVDDIDGRTWKVIKSWNSSPQASPQQSTTSSILGDSCHLDNSIYEAVLHCKRSIEK